jgi:hypothetical protein
MAHVMAWVTCLLVIHVRLQDEHLICFGYATRLDSSTDSAHGKNQRLIYPAVSRRQQSRRYGQRLLHSDMALACSPSTLSRLAGK